MKNVEIKICALIMTALIVGCSDNLTERTAIKLLEEQLGKSPVLDDITIGQRKFTIFISHDIKKPCIDLLPGYHRVLIENGYITVKDAGVSKSGWSEQRECNIEPAQKLEKVTLSKLKGGLFGDSARVKLADKKLSKILSITEPASMMGAIVSEVTYEYMLERTEIGSLLMKEKDTKSPIKHKQVLVKYKDGWGLPDR